MSDQRWSRISTFVASALVAAAAGPSAIAQGTTAQNEQESGGLEEVLVTAERREASLQDVPLAVSAISTEALENRSIQTGQDLQRIVPSLKMLNNITSPTNLSPSLRGSTVQDASLVTAESPFGIYVDDVYLARLNGNNTQLADIERVEVLRGPQGTLYGRNTLAGAIKFVTRNPGDDAWLDASIAAGNWQQFRASLSTGGPLGDNWAGSFAAQVNRKEGQFFNRSATANQSVGEERNWATRGKLRYRGLDNFDAVFSVSYTKSTNDAIPLVPATTPLDPTASRQFTSDELVPTFGAFTVNTPFTPRNIALVTAAPFGETKQLISSANLTWDLAGGQTLKSVTAYVNTKDAFSTDFSGNGVIVGANKADADQLSQEFQLQGSAFGDRLSYIVGAYLFNEKADQDFGWFFVTPVSTSQIKIETDSIAVFGQFDYQITDALKATAGLRWNRDSKEFSIAHQRTNTVLPFLPGGPPTDRVALENSYKAWLPKVGLDYNVKATGIFDSALVYGSLARGFKSGGYSAIAIFNLNDARTPYFPEKNWTYEVGTKLDMFDRRFRVNAALFWNEISDLQLNATAGGGTSFPVQNAGKADIKGLELDTTWVPVENLTLFFNAAFMDGEFKDLLVGASPRNATLAPVVVNGMNVGGFGLSEPSTPQVPDYTFNIGFDYKFPVSLGDQDGKIGFGVDYFRTDDYITAGTNDFRVTAYGRLGAFVSMEVGDNWEMRLSGKNLQDDDKIVSGSRALGGFIYLPRREVLFSVNYQL